MHCDDGAYQLHNSAVAFQLCPRWNDYCHQQVFSRCIPELQSVVDSHRRGGVERIRVYSIPQAYN